MTIVTIERNVRLPRLKRIQVYGVPGDSDRYVQYEAQMLSNGVRIFGHRCATMPPAYHVYFYPAKNLLLIRTFVKHKPVSDGVFNRVERLISMAIAEDLKSNPLPI